MCSVYVVRYVRRVLCSLCVHHPLVIDYTYLLLHYVYIFDLIIIVYYTMLGVLL